MVLNMYIFCMTAFVWQMKSFFIRFEGDGFKKHVIRTKGVAGGKWGSGSEPNPAGFGEEPEPPEQAKVFKLQQTAAAAVESG